MSELVLALLKQIPLKPKYKSYMYHCPICGGIVATVYEFGNSKQCRCGQKLMWEEEE